METEKKQWTKPELIVLVRSKPEEAVLAACKGSGGLSNMTSENNCRTSTPPIYCNGDCNVIGVS
jgi:hypothetical protein